jgi:hypothetical protein
MFVLIAWMTEAIITPPAACRTPGPAFTLPIAGNLAHPNPEDVVWSIGIRAQQPKCLPNAGGDNHSIRGQETECGNVRPASAFMIAAQRSRRPIMTNFLNFHAFATARGEGLHPELRLLFERAATSPCADVAIRHDGWLQSGPDPASERARHDALPLEKVTP